MRKNSKLRMIFFAGMSALMGFCAFAGGHASGQMDLMNEEKEYLDNLTKEIEEEKEN